MRKFSLLLIFALMFTLQAVPVFSSTTQWRSSQDVCSYDKKDKVPDDGEDADSASLFQKYGETSICSYSEGKHEKDDKPQDDGEEAQLEEE